MRSVAAMVAVAAMCAGVALGGSPWGPESRQKAQALVDSLTTTQKFMFVHGWESAPEDLADDDFAADKKAALRGFAALQTFREKTAALESQRRARVGGINGYVGGLPALSGKVPAVIGLEDGPQGVADGVKDVTAWPSALTVVASWNTTAYEAYGAAMGAEQRIKGTAVMLGPATNLARVPIGGRNFEYAGASPALASAYVAACTKGIQSNKVLGCIKHFVANNNDYDRFTISENVGTRALMELYFQPFAAAVDAGVGTAMCAYNRVNNTYACENAFTIGWLKGQGPGQGGFDGWLMSDWGATHSTVAAANAGLDAEMPSDEFFGPTLVQAVQNGSVSQSRIDDMLIRLFTPLYEMGWMDDPPTGNLSANASSAAHDALARDLAAQSHVLLKNDPPQTSRRAGGVAAAAPVLPLDASTLRTVAIFGDEYTTTGGGSGHVIMPYTVSPAEGVFRRINPGATRVANCTFYPNTDFYQPGNPSSPGANEQDCCDQCSAQPGCNFFSFASGTCWFKPTNDGKKSSPGVTAAACGPWSGATVNMTYMTGQDPGAAAALAAEADIAIVVVATDSSEGTDRANLSLPLWQDTLMSAVAKANPKTIAVVRSPGAVLMPWADEVPAIVATFMSGQEAGNALADVLFGDVNPAGRLPLSFPATEDGTWLKTQEQYPGIVGPGGYPEITYTEGLFIDYRYYLTAPASEAPLFWFGHGLSYTTFQWSQIQASGSITPTASATVQLTVSNTGSRDGAEVVQIYVGYPDGYGEPPRVLRHFDKIFLTSSQSQQVSFTVTATDLSYWDEASGAWQLATGTATIYACSASNVVESSVTVTVSN